MLSFPRSQKLSIFPFYIIIQLTYFYRADTKEFISACLHPSLHVRPEISALESHTFLIQATKGLNREGSNDMNKG
jgi:hypothetical protein